MVPNGFEQSPSKVTWEQAKITEDSNEPSRDCSVEKNIKAMDAYSKALHQDPSYTFSGISEVPVPRADIHGFFKAFRQQVKDTMLINTVEGTSCHAVIRLRKLVVQRLPQLSFSG